MRLCTVFYSFHKIICVDIFKGEMILIEIPVKSATYAMKGKQLLHRHSIRAYVGKRSDEEGCYYYLNIKEKNKDAAIELLQENQIIK